jgi:hypothetical protein
MKREYSNWVQIALVLFTALALICVGEFWFASGAVAIAIGLTIDEQIQRRKVKK